MAGAGQNGPERILRWGGGSLRCLALPAGADVQTSQGEGLWEPPEGLKPRVPRTDSGTTRGLVLARHVAGLRAPRLRGGSSSGAAHAQAPAEAGAPRGAAPAPRVAGRGRAALGGAARRARTRRAGELHS